MHLIGKVALLFLLITVGSFEPLAQQRLYTVTEQREPDALRRPFYGDTHVHTAYSFDVSSQDTRNTPADAYNFAKGGRMGIQPYQDGKPLRHIQLDRSLDFTALTDHAEENSRDALFAPMRRHFITPV